MQGSAEAWGWRWDRLRNIIRHRLLTASPLRTLRARAYRARLITFLPVREQLRRNDDALAAGLADAGVQFVPGRAVAQLMGLDLPALAGLSGAVIADPRWGAGTTRLEGDALVAAYPAFYRLGLAPGMLDTAEAYLGQPCLYLGATIKREAADGRIAGTRRWHMDNEDERMFRALLYLSSVAEGGGPFEFVAAGRSQPARAAADYRSGYIDDEDMAAMIPRDQWIEVRADAGDAVLFDGARVFHRAQTPRRADRYSITFAYVSRHPLQLKMSARLSRPVRDRLVATLGQRERACIPPAR